jgi:hypothetical protein
MTGSGGIGTAIQYPLDGEVDVMTLALAGDFDPISEGGDGAVGPAGAAVVGDVLVEVFGEVGLAVDVVPVPVGGDVFFYEVGMGQRVHHMLLLHVPIHNLHFIEVFSVDGRESREGEECEFHGSTFRLLMIIIAVLMGAIDDGGLASFCIK